MRANVDTPYDEIVKNPGLMPIVIAAKSLLDFKNEKEPLEIPDNDLENYPQFYLNFTELSEMNRTDLEEKERSDYFNQLVKTFLEETEGVSKKYNSVDKLRGKLLYGEDTQQAVISPVSGEIVFNFGRKL